MKYFSSILKKIATSTLIVSFFLPSVVFAYEASPVAITRNATYITEKSVRLNGRVNPNDMPDAKQWFEWGVSGQYQIVYETSHNSIRGRSTLLDTSANLVGLAPSTQYFYRQIAENGRGKDVGQTVYFTTKSLLTQIEPLVIVETKEPAYVTSESATLRGYVSPHGNKNASFWFQWGTTMTLENETPHRGHGGDSSMTEVKLSNLASGTGYFFRIVGENSRGRIYGATRYFVTTGTPSLSLAVDSEAPRDQVIATPDTSVATQKVVTSDNTGVIGGGKSFLPSTRLPGDIFNLGSLFWGKKNTVEGNTTSQPVSAATSQVAAAGASSGPFGTFWSNLTRNKAVEVTLENVGPKDVPMHSPVEYRVTYHYRGDTIARNAKLKITIPGDVVYIGDTTNNELLLEEGTGPERTYVLPIGQLENGSMRSVSIIGMTTGAAKGFPAARARMEYTDQVGGIQVVAANGGVINASNNTASVGDSSGNGLLPSSFLGWVVYIFVIALVFVGIRKAITYYHERKKEIENERIMSENRVAYSGGGRISQGL